MLNTFPWSNFGGIFFKNSIKADIISFSTTKNLSHERVVLTKEIIRLKALLVAGDFSVSSAIRDLENKLKQLVLKELSGVAIRSKGRWLKEGGKPSLFFFKLERERIQRNSIFSVLDSNEVEVSSHAKIEQEIVQFYSHLFSSEPIDTFCKHTCLVSIENHLECYIVTHSAAHLKTHVDCGRLSFLPIYLCTLSRLDALDCEVARGAQVQARARWADEGESSTAYFFRFEKKRATD